MSRKLIFTAAFIGLALCTSLPVYAAQDTITMHQVYQAAQAGKFEEAQVMMDKVLRDHPNSAKAHYVQAELFAKQGQINQAKTELNTAERLAPGLPFAKPQALQSLKAKLSVSDSHVARKSLQSPQYPAKPNLAQSGGIPSFVWIAGVLLLAFFIIRLIFRSFSGILGGNRYGNSGGVGGVPGGGGMGNAPGYGGGNGGAGSGLLGSLASGAAMGAGLVAGQALANRFMGNHQENAVNPLENNDPNSNMGGADFGVADNSSWDDGSSNVSFSNDDEWN
ncbi:MAG: tetratricopeptide repeat protein [Pseudomonadota bacterium]